MLGQPVVLLKTKALTPTPTIAPTTTLTPTPTVEPRTEVITYTIQQGDTIVSIADKFNLAPDTILWGNWYELGDDLSLYFPGQTIYILPVDGVYHTVVEGDTLDSIAEKYKVAAADIVHCPFNKLSASSSLPVGSKLIVPNGTKPYEVRKVTTYGGPAPANVSSAGDFMWPTSGYISQGYWYMHRAVDIANAVGVAIRAADGGYVTFTGWTDVGYGYLVVIDHGNGYQTYYAHLSDIFVTEGQVVSGGEIIGAMGSTGNSTGPHLHFEIRYQGYPTNPLIFLP